MACIDCPPVCGRASGSAVPGVIAQGTSTIAFISTIFGVLAKVISIKDMPWYVQIPVLLIGIVLLGLAIVALVWVTAYNQCEEQIYVATDKGIELMKGPQKCIAGVASEVKSDFSGFSMSWIAPWTAEHDRVNVVTTSRFWDTVESNMADVFCTDDEDGRASEYMRCYFYTDKVCKAARGSAVGATIGFIIAIPLMVFAAAAAVSAVGSCYAGATTGGVAWPLFVICGVCIAIMVVALLIVAAIVLGCATIGGLIAAATSESTPATPNDQNRDTLENIQVQVGDLVTFKGQMLIKEESDELFHSLKVNVLWWVKEAELRGVMPSEFSSNPFSYCDVNEVFYLTETDEQGQPVLVNHDGCSEFTNLLPTRCR